MYDKEVGLTIDLPVIGVPGHRMEHDELIVEATGKGIEDPSLRLVGRLWQSLGVEPRHSGSSWNRSLVGEHRLE